MGPHPAPPPPVPPPPHYPPDTLAVVLHNSRRNFGNVVLFAIGFFGFCVVLFIITGLLIHATS